ncbi:MAG: TIGR04141 family sporadically distributed protein, partial [Pseudomonadota bacterium]
LPRSPQRAIRCARRKGSAHRPLLPRRESAKPTVRLQLPVDDQWGSQQKFEACDLLDIKGKRLIHVKKSSRQSSVLSHFFKQGSNSARILKTIPEARAALIDKVRDLTNDATADAMQAGMNDTMNGWKVELHIVDAPRNDGVFMIPFFSRITLQDECRNLRGMAYDVSLRFIPTPAA